MKKFLILLVAVLFTAGALFAGGAQDKDDDEIIIGFNNGSTTVDFLRQVGISLEQVAEEYGVKLLVAESNFEAEKILPNVDNLLVQGADIIIDFNVNAEIGGSLVDYCAEKGVPVIGIDVLYTGASGAEGYFFGANNQMAGEVAGEGLAVAIKENWGGEIDTYLAFFNSENGDLVRLRLAGMVDGMRKAGIKISEDQIEWIEMGGGGSDTTLVANRKMTDWLTAHPDLTKIAVGTVNTETGQGVFSAVQASDR
ncbi:MAG: sugar ABC transporter substrate-binding protein, partial [Spirochaetales bacterium]|nr:sugar ABC transporter substrate-binding protein [Spirochaetales bacterium]